MARNLFFIMVMVFAAVTAGDVTNAASPVSGQLRIGVAYVSPPPGPTEFRVFTENGFEQEIGRELARSLGLRPVFVASAPENGKELLQTGAIDVIVKRQPTSTDAKNADVLETGFRSGVSVAMRTDTDIRTWDDLAGRTVCVSKAGFNEQRIAQRHGAKLRVSRAPALSLMLVRTGECDAALQDAALLARLFEDQNWHKFSATLPPVETSSLVVEVAKNSGLRNQVKTALDTLSGDAAWHARRARWARNVSFEVYLEQDAPDCH